MSSYQFRVRAENRYGIGDPSAPSEPLSIPSDSIISNNNTNTQIVEEIPPDIDVQITLGNYQEKYEKGEELGKGRFGTVFRMREKCSGVDFAGKIVKCIRVEEKKKVREEVAIMNLLRHPRLLQLVDAIEAPREIVIITEKINGGELFERIVADDFTLTEGECIQFMRQICEGVMYMHSRRIIHLDLKPENILCVSRNSYDIKLIDFGLAQRYTPEIPMKVLFGTPEFIAPEVINYEEISPLSDQWSLGVICYVLLSGLSPFMGDNDAETFSNITSAEYDFDDESFESVSPEAKDFISCLLVKRKEKRLSAEECLNHCWLCAPKTVQDNVLSTDKLKRFVIRRKWQKTGNAILAIRKMTNLSSRRTMSQENRIPEVPEECPLPIIESHSSKNSSRGQEIPREYPEYGFPARTYSSRTDSGISECSTISSSPPHYPEPIFGFAEHPDSIGTKETSIALANRKQNTRFQ